MKKQSGFTIIELVIVVVILGFLAVTAIPKFLDLTDQAKQANIEGMAGGYATGVSLARSQWEAEGRPQNTNDENSVNYDGTTLLLTTGNDSDIRPGYVVGLTQGTELAEANFTADNCIEIWQSIFQQPPGVTSDIDILNSESSMSYFVAKSGSGASTLCHYYLKESLDRNNNSSFADPGTDTETGNSFTYQPANSSVIVYIN